jgi:SAM-dependent methyltransferase
MRLCVDTEEADHNADVGVASQGLPLCRTHPDPQQSLLRRGLAQLSAGLFNCALAMFRDVQKRNISHGVGKKQPGEHMKNQTKQVGEFFDKISNQYDAKYEAHTNKFLAHLFRRRIESATNALPKSLGRVMDIGAGTGQLHRFLLENGFSFDDYIAVDVSEGMLSKSDIPEESRHVGTVHLPTLDRYNGTVDHFFLLGVTTYMSANELDATLNRIARLSSKDGLLVCTFTNLSSIEIKAQTVFSWLLKLFIRLSGKRLNVVAAQTFSRLIVSEAAMKSFLRPHGTIERIDYINQTFTPFNRLFTGASIRLESFLSRSLRRRPALLAVFSSDILFRVRLGRD